MRKSFSDVRNAMKKKLLYKYTQHIIRIVLRYLPILSPFPLIFLIKREEKNLLSRSHYKSLSDMMRASLTMGMRKTFFF